MSNPDDYTPIHDPTSRSDAINADLRNWYETHRETWWDRNAHFLVWRSYIPGLADGFMFAIVREVERLQDKYTPRHNLSPKCKKHQRMNEKTKTESRNKQAGAAQEKEDAEGWSWRDIVHSVVVYNKQSGVEIFRTDNKDDADLACTAHNSATASLRARNEELERKLKDFGGTQSRG